MKVKVIDLINLYIGYRTAQQVNERLSTKFSYSLHKNMAKLQAEAEFWDNLSPEKREEIAQMEVEVDLHKVSMEDLPEYFPSYMGKTAFQVFAPVIVGITADDVPSESTLLKALVDPPALEAVELPEAAEESTP